MGDARWRVSALFSRLWFALLCAICVAACSPHIPVRPLPELHTPNISKVPGFEAYYKRNAGYVSDSLRDFTAYQPYGADLSGRMLVEAGASLLDIGLDGSDGRKIADGDLCIDRPAVTRDSQWMACTRVFGRLIVQSLTEAPPYESHLLPTGATFPRLVAWGPDGRQLVAVETAESDCRLNVYRAEPPYMDVRLGFRIRIPQLASQNSSLLPCGHSDLGWSPDGRWLAMAVRAGDYHTTIFALDLQQMKLPSADPTDSATSVTAPPNAVAELGRVNGDEPRLTWPNGQDILTFTGYSLVNVNLLTAAQTVLIRPGDAQICGASWTPDGAQLVFTVCRPYTGNPDIGAPPAQLYVYTP